MKKLEALIDPTMLRTVKATLTSGGVVGLTISEVRTAANSQRGDSYRSSRDSIDWSPRIKLELLVRDNHADYLIGVIRFQDVIRIRTRQHGSEVL